MRTAVKTAALMSLGVPLATMPAIAQDDEGELAPVVITGSNIPTVELEGQNLVSRQVGRVIFPLGRLRVE